MLSDKIKITTKKSDYLEYPYTKRLHLYGFCVWEDDYMENVEAEKVLEDFINALRETEIVEEE